MKFMSFFYVPLLSINIVIDINCGFCSLLSQCVCAQCLQPIVQSIARVLVAVKLNNSYIKYGKHLATIAAFNFRHMCTCVIVSRTINSKVLYIIRVKSKIKDKIVRIAVLYETILAKKYDVDIIFWLIFSLN